MPSATSEILAGSWNLERARQSARAIEASPRAVRALIRTLFGADLESRKRSADVARRITERDPTPLHSYADQLAGLLATIPLEEQRTRWHLGLVVPRIPHTHEQRIRAARLMLTLAEDEGNVVRCSAVEGLALLAADEPSLRDCAEEIIARYLHNGTLAMKCRARHAASKLFK